MKKSIYILALGGFSIVTTEFSVIGILPVIAKNFHVSIDTAGWLLSAFALTIAITGPFTVMLTSKINRKWLMVTALAVFVVSNIASVFSPNFTCLMIARIVPAFMHPVFWSVAITSASRQVVPKDAPKAIAIVMGAISVGTVLGVPLTTYIANLVNWQAAFIAAGIINIIGLTAVIINIPSIPVTKTTTRHNQVKSLANPQRLMMMLLLLIFRTLCTTLQMLLIKKLVQKAQNPRSFNIY